MTSIPPIRSGHPARPPRRPATGRRGQPVGAAAPRSFGGAATLRTRAAWLAVLTLVGLGGCVGPPAPSSSPGASASTQVVTTRPGPTIRPPGDDGLLVAVDGVLFETDPSGVLVPLDRPGAPIVSVSAGGGRILILDRIGAWLATGDGEGRPSWSSIDLSTLAGPEPPLLALAPDGHRFVGAIGVAQDARLDLVIVGVEDATSRTITLPRGINGPPAWIGPGAIGIDVIRPDQASGLSVVEVASGGAMDVTATGSTVSASADGATVAIDDPASGAVMVGARDDVLGARGSPARIASPANSGPDGLALAPDGQRLAILRRLGSQIRIDLLRLEPTGWEVRQTIAVPGDPLVSMAWLR